ncbi:MAG: SRPBCC family protein [Candidatus Dormibacteraeota bacterium]|uniref:SRPBCC family protein n=1 Tax=Candidatus Amunia macphersoniae TaxID=3127014 RepID=A0A934KN03_9BACT|nr:SRPBCC family protein [Candidatus Dormibacteraeota bacterium]
MIEASATAILPVPAKSAFAVVSDVSNADWLPAVRGVRHVGGPKRGVGARFEVEAGMVGRHLRGILEVREMVEPKRMVLVLEEGLDLTVIIELKPVRAGCELRVAARYSVGGAFGGAVERASQPAARREVARAVEQLSARFGRDDEPAAESRSR